MPDRAPASRFLFQPEAFSDESFPVREALREISETFDAMEEANVGEWTPELTFSGATTGITYSDRDGAYLRIGRFVMVTGTITLSSKGTATGSAIMRGLPFPVSNELAGTLLEASGSLSYATGMAGLTSAPGMFVRSDGTMYLTNWGAIGSSNLTDANFTNTTNLRLAASFITDED